jgi:hypothetical protein
MTLICAVSVRELATGRPAVVTGAMGKTCPGAYVGFPKYPAWGMAKRSHKAWRPDPPLGCFHPSSANRTTDRVHTHDGGHKGGAHMTAKRLPRIGESCNLHRRRT